MNAPIRAVRLIVCGNADRGDDGAALVAVAHFLPKIDDPIRTRIEIRRCGQLDPLDIVDVPSTQACVIVDTVVGIEPGSVVTIPLGELAARCHEVTPRSSHALPIDQVLGIAQAIRGTLPEGTFIGIGGSRFGFGPRRSRAVTAGLKALERTTEGEVRRFASAALVLGKGGHPGV
ncbi:MAG TPA: hydrogenase maturation protease [Candidatus Acidoferrales bacterium]|jgi:hydrogenase maturation protease|nr:hydrogenase maturation protease [Candidatus Acidoferrales bacterium]